MAERVEKNDPVRLVMQRTERDAETVGTIIDAMLAEIYEALKRGESVALEAYLAGLADAGRTGDPDLVRLAYSAWFALWLGSTAPITTAHFTSEAMRAYSAQGFGRAPDAIARRVGHPVYAGPRPRGCSPPLDGAAPLGLEPGVILAGSQILLLHVGRFTTATGMHPLAI